MGIVSKFIWFEGWVGTHFHVVESHPDIHDYTLENNPTRQESYDVPDSKEKKREIMDTMRYPDRSPFQEMWKKKIWEREREFHPIDSYFKS